MDLDLLHQFLEEFNNYKIPSPTYPLRTDIEDTSNTEEEKNES